MRLESAAAGQLTGDAELVVVSFFEGTNREELMTAGDATVGGHPEKALERRGEAGYVLGGDALEILIPAYRAVRGEAVGEWRWAAAKTYSAAGTSPGQAADQCSDEINESASARPTADPRMAGGANHQRFPLVTWGCRK